jgi:heptosyltransferase I
MSRIVVKSGLPFTVAPKSLCILRLSAIGDVCHTLAVVRAIQDQWPETRLTWIIGKLEHSLIGDIADIEFLVYDKGQEKQSLKQLKQKLAGREFDALLHMQISMRSSRISRLISSPIKLGYDKARAKDFQWLFTNQRIAAVSQQHVMDALFGFAESIGVERPPNPKLRWDIPLTEAQQAFAQQQNPQNKPTLVISPCSSQRARNFRNWSVENYIAAAKHAEQLGMAVIVTGGPSELEKEYGDAISKATKATNLVAKTNLKELLALLQQASGLLSPDSGPAHMATTVGTAVIGLYATSNPARTGPYLSNEHWVVNAYPKACQQYLGKSVSEMKWGQRVRHPEAMDLIELDAVCEQITRLTEQA